tara:strand:+ start:11 stop:247 length:237 start_codon:yes stop_codon:yes gene_type:complete
MYNNSDAELAIIQFFEQLKKSNNSPLQAFLSTVGKNITVQEMDDFKTPNFERLWNHAEKSEIFFITPERISQVRNHLN